VAAMARVPYFASVMPHVVRMEPGLAEVRIPKWVMVYNHLGTVHAIASCNAAEVAMGMLMEATVPRSHRWIPKDYKDQARPGEGHHVAARTRPTGPAGFRADHRRRRHRRTGQRDRPKRQRSRARRHHHLGHAGRLGMARRPPGTSRARDARGCRRTPAPRSPGRRGPLFGEDAWLGRNHDLPFSDAQNGHWCDASKSVMTPLPPGRNDIHTLWSGSPASAGQPGRPAALGAPLATKWLQ
jgi:hypothetical protein